MQAIWDWFLSLDWKVMVPEILGKATGFFLGFAVSWYLLFRQRLKAIQRFQQGDSDDVIYQMHKLVPLAGGTGEVGMLFRNIGPRTTVNQLYDNPAARDLVAALGDKTTLENPVLATEGTGGFELLNIAFGYIAGQLATTPFPRKTWLFVMTCEDRQVVRKKCVRCFLIQPDDLAKFADWTWCCTMVRVERPYHWFRIVALHQIAKVWREERAAAAEQNTTAMPLVDRQAKHNRVREMSVGVYPDEQLVTEPAKVNWQAQLAELKRLGLSLAMPTEPK